MNWKDKAQQIADEIIRKVEKDCADPNVRNKVLEALRLAATKGMMWECENWVLKRQ